MALEDKCTGAGAKGAGQGPVVAGLDFDSHGGIPGIGHLARGEPLPDERVYPQLVGTQDAPKALRHRRRVGRPDGLVRFLGAFAPGRVDAFFVRDELVPPGAGDPIACLPSRDWGNAHRVGAHVGDESGLTVDSLVELLGDAHRPRGAHAEAVHRSLLEGAGREGRHRSAALLALRHRSDAEL